MTTPTVVDSYNSLISGLESAFPGLDIKRSSPRIFVDTLTPPVIYISWQRTDPSSNQRMGGPTWVDRFNVVIFTLGEFALLDAVQDLSVSSLPFESIDRFSAEELPQKADYGLSFVLTYER